VRPLNTSARFSGQTAEQRAFLLLDREGATLSLHGSLLLGEGRLEGRPIRLAVTDRRIAGGAFGVAESAALAGCLRRCRADGVPVVMALDSAGARLDEGLPALGAFRTLFREALQTRLAGLPMIALLARDCFGGASMLAAICSARAATNTSRYGMSGPSVIEALGGREELDSRNARAVRALFGARSRARLGAIDRLCGDAPVSCRQAVYSLLSTCRPAAPDLQETHRRLGQRLPEGGAVPPADPQGALAAFSARRTVGAAELWRLADRVLALDPGAALTIRLDSPGQATTRIDESLVLSEFVVHCALCIAQRGSAGNDIRLDIRGEAAGGIYVALAASAARVDAAPSAQVRLLPRLAIEKILRRAPEDAGLDEALSAGVIDGVTAA
jgi:acetyl-CoA carboxylase beta subunit